MELQYRECDINISNLRLNPDTHEWHCDIALTIHCEDVLTDKSTHTFAVGTEEQALKAAVSKAKEVLDSRLP